MDRAEHELTVAIDATPLVGGRTGIGHFVAELLAALAGLGDGPAVLPFVLSRRASLGGGALPAGTRRLHLPAGLAVRLWAVPGAPAFDGRLDPATVVHGTNFVAPPSRQRAVVITVHDMAFDRFPELCTPAQRAAGRVARRLARRGAWVHTHSEAVAAEVRDRFDTDRVRAVPPGVPHLPPTEIAPPEATTSVARAPAGAGPFVLALGTIEPRKRHADLVAAFGRVAEAHPDLRLVLAGPDGPARPVVDAVLASLPPQVRGRVVLPGHVDDSTRAALLRGAAVFAYPSLYEGFGLPVVEAMAVGTPVVAGAGGSVTECADGAALLVDGGPDEFAVQLAGALDRLLGDSALRERLIEAGLQRSAEFRWDTTARRIAALYEEAASA